MEGVANFHKVAKIRNRAKFFIFFTIQTLKFYFLNILLYI